MFHATLRTRARRGTSLIEVTVAMGVALIAVLGYSASLATGSQLGRAETNRTLAMNSARVAYEALSALETHSDLVRFDGYCFTVPGLPGCDLEASYPDGSTPPFVHTTVFPVESGFPVEPGEDGPLLGPLLEDLGLEPARISTFGFGLIRISDAGPGLMLIDIEVHYRDGRGNQRLRIRGHAIARP